MNENKILREIYYLVKRLINAFEVFFKELLATKDDRRIINKKR